VSSLGGEFDEDEELEPYDFLDGPAAGGDNVEVGYDFLTGPAARSAMQSRREILEDKTALLELESAEMDYEDASVELERRKARRGWAEWGLSWFF